MVISAIMTAKTSMVNAIQWRSMMMRLQHRSTNHKATTSMSNVWTTELLRSQHNNNVNVCHLLSRSSSTSSSSTTIINNNNNQTSSYLRRSKQIRTIQTTTTLRVSRTINTTNNNNNNTRATRLLFSTISRGYDLTADFMTPNDNDNGELIKVPPKIILSGYSNTGFDVMNVIKRIDTTEINTEQGLIHMNGNIIAFPNGCFLWKNISTPADVSIESLSIIHLYRPKLQYLFIGYNNNNTKNNNLSHEKLQKIQKHFSTSSLHNIVIDVMSLDNAIGTFNLLNAEDRQVAVALIIENNDNENDEE